MVEGLPDRMPGATLGRGAAVGAAIGRAGVDEGDDEPDEQPEAAGEDGDQGVNEVVEAGLSEEAGGLADGTVTLDLKLGGHGDCGDRVFYGWTVFVLPCGIGWGMKIKMEPELEEMAGNLNPTERRAMAAKLERWAHELRVTSSVMDVQGGPRRRLAVPRLSRRRQFLN